MAGPTPEQWAENWKKMDTESEATQLIAFQMLTGTSPAWLELRMEHLNKIWMRAHAPKHAERRLKELKRLAEQTGFTVPKEVPRQ